MVKLWDVARVEPTDTLSPDAGVVYSIAWPGAPGAPRPSTNEPPRRPPPAPPAGGDGLGMGACEGMGSRLCVVVALYFHAQTRPPHTAPPTPPDPLLHRKGDEKRAGTGRWALEAIRVCEECQETWRCV